MVWPHSPWLHTLWQESGSIAGWSVRGPVDDPDAGGDNQGTEAGSGEELARQRSLREAAGGDNQGRKLAFGAPPYSPPPLPPSPPPPLPPPPSGPWSTQGANQGKRLDPTSDELLWTGTVAGDGALRLVCGCGPTLAPPYLPPPDPASSSPTFCLPLPPLPLQPLAPPHPPCTPLLLLTPPHPLCRYDAAAGQLLQGTYVLEATAGEEGAEFYLQVQKERSLTPNSDPKPHPHP